MTRDRNPPTDPLEAAAVALDQGRPSELAERLREVWRATRDPGLAGSYELLLREFSAPPLTGKNPADRDRSWCARARQHAGDPLELPVLLAEPWTPDTDDLERLSLLEPWSPDPLLASTLARWLLIPNVAPLPKTRPVIMRMVELLAAQGDPRQLATLERLSLLPRDLERTREQLAKVRVTSLAPLQRAHSSRLARRAELRRAHEARTAELLAAVHADPDHDEPRLVYADWLAAQGDPHAEFITLQIERARIGGAVSAREQELLARHGLAWAGAINPVLNFASRVFERGFLVSASVEVRNFHGDMADAGEWSTLRILDGLVSGQLLKRAPLDHLRELYGYLRLEHFIAQRADNRLAAVTHYECSLADPYLPLEIPLGLRTLLVRHALDDRLLALADATAIAGLEQLGVRYLSNRSDSMADHRERGMPRHRFELLRGQLPTHVRRLFLIDDATARASQPCGWTLTFERDELDVFSRLRVDWQRPAHDRSGHGAVTQLLGVLSELGLGSFVRLVLGSFDSPARTTAIDLLDELARAAGCELMVEPLSARGASPRLPHPALRPL